MRIKSSVNNILTASVGQLINILIQFIMRTIFIKQLSAEYLGLNGLFTNIISMLSFAELGLGNAIVYSLYKPLADRDYEKMKSLLIFYKKSYTVVGISIFILGILSVQYIEFFIKDIPNIPNIKLIYILFILNSVISYFYSYKSSFLMADQKGYIYNIYYFFFKLICTIIQIIILLLTSNYIVFLICQIIFTWISNYFIHVKFEVIYEELSKVEYKKVDKTTFNEIIKNTLAMVTHKLGWIVVFATDNILISKYVGLISTGIYSNYKMIISTIEGIIGQVFAAITASVGNLVVSESSKKVEEIFNTMYFASFWISGFSAIALISLINLFIDMWVGESLRFNKWIVLILIINFYIGGMRRVVLVFRDAYGLFWNDRYKALFEAAINLTVSIILVKKLGTIGIFIGTLISTLITCFWIEPYILYKYGFKSSMYKYFKKYILYVIVTIVAGLINIFLCSLITGDILISFILKMLISIFVPNIVFLIVFYNSKDLKMLLNIFKKIVYNN